MTDSAQVFTGIHDTPVYIDLFNRSLRAWVAAPLVLFGGATVALTVVFLDSGYAAWILGTGALITALACGAGALIPAGKPSVGFRLLCLARTLRPGQFVSRP